jgi:large subunit ribosomal protein L30
MADAKMMKVTLTKGLMGRKESHRATARGLGLKWRSHSVEVIDTPETRGMVAKISYMVEVTESTPQA